MKDLKHIKRFNESDENNTRFKSHIRTDIISDMSYLVIKDNTIIQICTSIEDLLEYLEVNITDNGVVEIGNKGVQLPTTYNMKEFTKDEVINDIKRNCLKRIEVALQIGIFKLERI